jgi:hypothetical protein
MVRNRGGDGSESEDDDEQSLTNQDSDDNWQAMFMNIGFDEDIATEVVVGQKINNWRTVQSMRYGAKGRIETLFKGISKVEVEDDDGNKTRIKVPEIVTYRFSQLVHYADYQRRRHRSCKLRDCTPAFFDKLEPHRHIVDSYKPTPMTLAALSDDTSRIQTEPFRQWDLAFMSYRGQDGVPVAYMFRENIVPPDEEDDDEDNYDTPDEEMVNRYPMLPEGQRPDPINPNMGPFTPEVQADMRVVASVLVTAIGKTRALTFASRGIQNQSARAIFFVVKEIFLGAGVYRSIMQTTQTKLQSLSYTGDKGNFTFPKVIEILEKLHNQHAELVDQGANDGNHIGEDTKVDHLLRILRAPWCEATRSQILANGPLQRNYVAARILFQNTYAAERASNPNPTNTGTGKRNSSALQSNKQGGRGRGGKRGGGGRPMPTASDFDPEELRAARIKMKPHVPKSAPAISSSNYRKLTDAERFALKQLRNERDAKETKATAALKSEVASLKSQVAQLSSARGGGGGDDSSDPSFTDSEEDEPPRKKRPHDNRGHRALESPGRQSRSPHRR